MAVACIPVPFEAASVGCRFATPDTPVDVVVHGELQAAVLDGAGFAHSYGWYGLGVERVFGKEVDPRVPAMRVILPGHVGVL